MRTDDNNTLIKTAIGAIIVSTVTAFFNLFSTVSNLEKELEIQAYKITTVENTQTIQNDQYITRREYDITLKNIEAMLSKLEEKIDKI